MSNRHGRQWRGGKTLRGGNPFQQRGNGIKIEINVKKKSKGHSAKGETKRGGKEGVWQKGGLRKTTDRSQRHQARARRKGNVEYALRVYIFRVHREGRQRGAITKKVRIAEDLHAQLASRNLCWGGVTTSWEGGKGKKLKGGTFFQEGEVWGGGGYWFVQRGGVLGGKL